MMQTNATLEFDEPPLSIFFRVDIDFDYIPPYFGGRDEPSYGAGAEINDVQAEILEWNEIKKKYVRSGNAINILPFLNADKLSALESACIEYYEECGGDQ